uniref:CCHC-type domain-containing protein n=1 Tax=Tanacetum cinerariifolium TaxID=118510 RepID=A0A699GZY5_TANCI|nr:hypothetical protein [Tanacetum cinerariifolium]
MANVPLNDPNVDASAIVPVPMNPDHAPAQPVGIGNGFAPQWIGGNISNNQNGWIEEDTKEEEYDPKEDLEEDSKEDPKEDDDGVMEMDDEADVIDPYMDDGSNNPPPPNSEDEEIPLTSPIILDADGKMEKLMSKRIDTERRMKKKFKEQDRHFVGLGCDNIEMDRAVRNVMSDLSGLKKLVKDLSDRFDEYEGSKVFKDKKVLEKELVNERNGKEFYQEFDVYMCRMLQKCQKSEDSFYLPLGSDAANAAVAVATFDIDADDDDTAPMDSQPYEPTMPPRKSIRGNPPPPLTQDTVATLGIEAVIRKTWAEMKVMMTEEFCPPEVIQRMECELWNLRVKEMDISSYTTRFNKLIILCPEMVPMERKKVQAYIRGLSENIKGEVTSSEPTTLNKAIRMAHTLIEHKVKTISEREADNKKRKWDNIQGSSNSDGRYSNSNRNNNYPSNRNYNNNCNNNKNQRQGNVRAMTNVGNQNINEAGQNIRHKARDCWLKVVATSANSQLIMTCYGCGEKGHIKTNCPVRNNLGRSGARGQAYALRDGDQNLGPNGVMGTFLLNNHYTRVLFDSRSDKIFMNVNFSHLIDIEPVKVDHSYEVKFADRRVVSTNTILKGCALNLVNHLFKIDLMPIKLGTSDVIIGMDWLILHDAVIVCGKKEVHVPFKKRTLVVKGDDCVSRLKVVSCVKVKKYLDRGSYLFVAQVIEKEPAERRPEDVHVICKFPDVFPEDLPGLPPP